MEVFHMATHSQVKNAARMIRCYKVQGCGRIQRTLYKVWVYLSGPDIHMTPPVTPGLSRVSNLEDEYSIVEPAVD